MNRESKILDKLKDSNVSSRLVDNIVFLNGNVKSYDDWVEIGLKIGSIGGIEGVVNNIRWDNKKPNKRFVKHKEIYDLQKKKQIGT